MTCSPSSRTVVCHEIFDENSLPSEEEIKDYAVKIGIDPQNEPHLLPLACDGLMQALPADWKPCYDEELQGYYYYNTKTSQSQWEHPLDEVYRNLVKKSRSESVSSAGDEDSKTSAKEDLKSFEEAVSSEILSKSMDTFKSNFGSSDKLLNKKGVGQVSPLRTTTKLTSTLSPLSEERPSSVLFKVKKNEKKLMIPQEKHPRVVKRAELTLTGGGSTFLRKNSASSISPPEEAEQTILPQVKVVITTPAAGEEENYPKSILRDKSPTKLWDVDPRDMSSEEKTLWRKQELDEERKSVRFKLEEELQINFQVPDDEDELEEVDEVEEAAGVAGGWNSDEEAREEEEIISKMKSLASQDDIQIKEEDDAEKEDEEEANKEECGDSSLISKNTQIVVNLKEETEVVKQSHDSCTEVNVENDDASLSAGLPNVEKRESSPVVLDLLKEKEDILEKEMKETLEAHRSMLHEELIESKKQLEEEHARKLQQLKSELAEEEEESKLSLTLDMKNRLDVFEKSLKKEEEDKKKKIREAFNQSLKGLEDELNALKEENTNHIKAEREKLQSSFAVELEQMITKERETNESELKKSLQKLKDEMNEQASKEIESLKAQLTLASSTRLKTIENEFKKEIEEIERERKKALEEKKRLESHELNKVKDSNYALENLRKEIAENLENQKQKLLAEQSLIIEKLKEEHDNRLEKLQMDFKIEEENLRREKGENLEKLKERLNSEHEAEVKKLRELIDRRNKYLEEQEKQTKQEIAKIELENSKCEQLQRQVELLSLKLRDGKRMLEETRAAKPDDRVFEKLRCEKRILEDKYRTLKEKYIKMKSEIKATADKRAAKKGENCKGGTGSETDKSSSQRAGLKIDSAVVHVSPHQETAKIIPNNNNNSSNCKQDVCIVTVGPTPTKEKVPFPTPEPHDLGSDVGEEVLSGGADNGLRPPATPRIQPSSPISPAGTGAGDLSSSITSPPEDSHTGGTASSSGTERPPRPAGFEPRKRKQFRLKSSSTSRLCKGRDMSPVENLRKQLKKLEDLEDLFPVTTHTDMYLRYPFSDSGQFGSSELEFFRHRIHLERDSVRRAKEFLRQQRQCFQRRQRELRQKQHQDQLQLHQQNPRSQMEMLQSSFGKEERELTDMEVSLHRTRSLLGEKIIRLRHLEQSLQRASLASACAAAAVDGNPPSGEEHTKRNTAIPPHLDRTAGGTTDATLSDLSSHSGSSGFSSTELGTEPTGRTNINDGPVRNYQESSAIVQSLEKLNSEIRSIWEVLSKQHGTGNIKMGPPQLVLNPPPMGWPAMSNSQSMRPPLSEQLQSFRNQHHLGISRGNSSRPTSLAERTQSLRTWLRQARLDSSASGIGGGQGSL